MRIKLKPKSMGTVNDLIRVISENITYDDITKYEKESEKYAGEAIAELHYPFIKRDDVNKQIDNFTDCIDDDTIIRLKKTISKIPSADVEQVIYCKDCMHNGSNDTDCPLRHWGIHDYDFCSWAEPLIDTCSK